jgi:hypothetical protein
MAVKAGPTFTTGFGFTMMVLVLLATQVPLLAVSVKVIAPDSDAEAV